MEKIMHLKSSNTRRTRALYRHLQKTLLCKKLNFQKRQLKKRLKQYVKIQKEIHEWEGRNLPKALMAKKEQAKHLSDNLAESEKIYKQSCEKVAKEKADVDKLQNPSIKSFFKDQKEFDEKLSKEQEGYLEAVSEQEVSKKQLEGLQTQKKDSEIQDMTKDMNKLLALYDEQDKILNDIFKGQYGSDLENKLEEEVEQLLDTKERIGVAKFKWTNGRLLLQHATAQLAYAVKRWQDLGQVPQQNNQVKYQLATETRSYLIAARQNIMSAKWYLNNIQFPYCEPEEILTLDRACTNIYFDMQTEERHQHALQCFSVTHRRCAALLQWFENVIENIIEKDFLKAKADLSPKENELRKERLRLMKEKIGGDFKILDKDTHEEFEQDILQHEHVTISKPEGGVEKLNLKESSNLPAATPLPLHELAPPPTQEDLFGNIEQLKKQHEQEMAQIEKAQESNKARIEQGLQEKLRERRTKRSRLQEG
ncbi:uncharacterized protein LOC131952564 isoform X2 [Physella acuta]|uniref:uncharacterized protein LOC131952564 isoform X2 n=1 Tax=Physella acuta TaxID=109671 RepID=UPI0027DE050B|nr:uncharacterized protein LOC131952564 isoform X2 [Physella acuta]